MEKRRGLLLSSIVITLVMVFVSSCKDDEPAPPAKLSFAESIITVNEDDDVIEIEIVLDKPVKEDITVEYSLQGTAIDKVTDPNDYDYEILSDYLEVDINEGETTGVIEIQLYSDFGLEDDETIEIELQNVDTDAVELTSDDDTEITVVQEDGLIVLLEWPSSAVDMDLILRGGQNTTTWDGFLTASFYGFPEIIFLPNVLTIPAYGLSYSYYDGTADPLNFTVSFIELKDGAVETEPNWLKFNAQYTIANKNTWTDINTTKVVQTFVKSGGIFTNFSSPITIPISGSRIESNTPSVIGTSGDVLTLSNGAKIVLGKMKKN